MLKSLLGGRDMGEGSHHHPASLFYQKLSIVEPFRNYCLTYTLRRDSSLHCIPSSQAIIQLYKDSSKVTEMKIYSGMSCLF